MEKIKLKLGDHLQLESELNGYMDPQTGTQIYEGFTKQNLSIILKYELTELGETLTKERKRIETLRDELIKKYGEDDGKGGMMVKMHIEQKDDEGNIISKTFNPKYIEFDNEYGTLLNQEKELEYPEITKDDLKDAGKSKDKYMVLFKLIKKDKKEEGTN
jgi:hypothetical protein